MKILTRAAGVTFEGRQEMLQQMLQTQPWRDITLKLTKYEGEDAIMLEDYATKQHIGWIPKNQIEKFKGVRRMAGRVVASKRTLGLQLFEHQEPTQRQYWAIRRYCERKGIPMPPYTRAAYESLFAVLKSDEK